MSAGRGEGSPSVVRVGPGASIGRGTGVPAPDLQIPRVTPRAVLSRLTARLGRVPTLITSGGLLVSGVLTSVIASRALGASGRGEYVAWQAWAAAIGTFAVAGLPQAVVLDKDRTGRHRIGELALSLGPTIGVALPALSILLVFRRPDLLVIPAVLLVVAANQIAAVAIAEAQRMGRMAGEFNIARSLPQLAGLATMVALLLAGSTSSSVWLVMVAGCQAAVALAWAAAITDRGPVRPGCVPNLVRNSVRLALGNWATALQYRMDLLAVAMLFPPEIVAFYAVGAAAQTAVLAAGQSGGMHWFARRGRAFDDRQGHLGREIAKTTGIAAVIALAAGVTAQIWVPALYGETFSPSIPLVVVLCGVGVLQSVDYLLTYECLMAGRGPRLARYRTPALLTLLAGFTLVRLAGLPVIVVAVLSGVGFAVSVAALLRTKAADSSTRRDQEPVSSDGETRSPTDSSEVPRMSR